MPVVTRLRSKNSRQQSTLVPLNDPAPEKSGSNCNDESVIFVAEVSNKPKNVNKVKIKRISPGPSSASASNSQESTTTISPPTTEIASQTKTTTRKKKTHHHHNFHKKHFFLSTEIIQEENGEDGDTDEQTKANQLDVQKPNELKKQLHKFGKRMLVCTNASAKMVTASHNKFKSVESEINEEFIKALQRKKSGVQVEDGENGDDDNGAEEIEIQTGPELVEENENVETATILPNMNNIEKIQHNDDDNCFDSDDQTTIIHNSNNKRPYSLDNEDDLNKLVPSSPIQIVTNANNDNSSRIIMGPTLPSSFNFGCIASSSAQSQASKKMIMSYDASTFTSLNSSLARNRKRNNTSSFEFSETLIMSTMTVNPNSHNIVDKVLHETSSNSPKHGIMEISEVDIDTDLRMSLEEKLHIKENNETPFEKELASPTIVGAKSVHFEESVGSSNKSVQRYPSFIKPSTSPAGLLLGEPISIYLDAMSSFQSKANNTTLYHDADMELSRIMIESPRSAHPDSNDLDEEIASLADLDLSCHTNVSTVSSENYLISNLDELQDGNKHRLNKHIPEWATNESLVEQLLLIGPTLYNKFKKQIKLGNDQIFPSRTTVTEPVFKTVYDGYNGGIPRRTK